MSGRLGFVAASAFVAVVVGAIMLLFAVVILIRTNALGHPPSIGMTALAISPLALLCGVAIYRSLVRGVGE